MAEKEKKKKGGVIKRYLLTILAIIVASGLLVALFLFGLSLYTKHGESVSVPSVKGLQVEEAAGILKKASLGYVVVDSVFLTDGIPGAIIEQVPDESSNVKKNRVIFLKMQAKSVEMVTIPALKDFSQRQAVSTLNSLGFMNIAIKEVPSAYRGLVIDMTHRGKSIEQNTKVPKGDAITLTVGAGGEVLIDSLIDIIPEYDPQDLSSDVEEDSVDNSFFE